jgi:tetratricopeptide (TPR) repeat protein
MGHLIPDMLKNKEGDFEVVNCLVAYALAKDPPDAKLVLQALNGLRDQDILQREDTTQLISEVVSRFGRSPGLELAQLPILAKIIRGYEADPQKWPSNHRVQVADSYCLVNRHAKAEPIYREILKDNPDYISALRGLGISLAYQRKFKEGIVPSRKAWNQGDKLSLSVLAACCLGARDYDGMKDLIPPLLERRKDDMESLNGVIAYAITKPSPDRELFFKAIDGFTDEQLLRNEEVTHNTILGLKRFGEKKRAEELEKLKAKQDKGEKA